jgi:hypothetical protein
LSLAAQSGVDVHVLTDSILRLSTHRTVQALRSSGIVEFPDPASIGREALTEAIAATEDFSRAGFEDVRAEIWQVLYAGDWASFGAPLKRYWGDLKYDFGDAADGASILIWLLICFTLACALRHYQQSKCVVILIPALLTLFVRIALAATRTRPPLTLTDPKCEVFWPLAAIAMLALSTAAAGLATHIPRLRLESDSTDAMLVLVLMLLGVLFYTPGHGAFGGIGLELRKDPPPEAEFGR